MEREKVFLDMTSSMNDVNEEELRFDKALLDIKDIERKKSYENFKRIIDFFLACIGIIFCSPVFCMDCL